MRGAREARREEDGGREPLGRSRGGRAFPPSCRGRARRCLPRPRRRRRARTDWRRAAPVPPAGGGHRGPAPPGAHRCPGSRDSVWGGRAPGDPDGSSPRRRGGRGEGSLSSSSRGTRWQHLRGGRLQRRCMRPAGGGVPGRQRGGAERGQRRVMRSWGRTERGCPLLSSARAAGVAQPRSRCSRAWAEGTGGPGAAAEGLRREQGLRPGRTEPRSSRARSTEGKERQAELRAAARSGLRLVTRGSDAEKRPEGRAVRELGNTLRGQREGGPGSGAPLWGGGAGRRRVPARAPPAGRWARWREAFGFTLLLFFSSPSPPACLLSFLPSFLPPVTQEEALGALHHPAAEGLEERARWGGRRRESDGGAGRSGVGEPWTD